VGLIGGELNIVQILRNYSFGFSRRIRRRYNKKEIADGSLGAYLQSLINQR